MLLKKTNPRILDLWCLQDKNELSSMARKIRDTKEKSWIHVRNVLHWGTIGPKHFQNHSKIRAPYGNRIFQRDESATFWDHDAFFGFIFLTF